jgi:hypothetical protein
MDCIAVLHSIHRSEKNNRRMNSPIASAAYRTLVRESIAAAFEIEARAGMGKA